MKAKIIVLSVAMYVASCASMHQWQYAWEPDESAPYCEQPLWKQVKREAIPGWCSVRGVAASPDTSCAVGCVVFSEYSEEQAKRIQIDGMTLYQHEADMHVRRRLKHPR